MIPLGIVGWFAFQVGTSAEDCVYLAFGFLVLVAFAAMLGLHSGLGRESSRQAIASSMGTIFFLFVGIFILLILLVEARGSFANQIQAFLLFILGAIYGATATVAEAVEANKNNAT